MLQYTKSELEFEELESVSNGECCPLCVPLPNIIRSRESPELETVRNSDTLRLRTGRNYDFDKER